MALRSYTRSVDGTIPVQALIYDDERILGSQDEVGIYDGPIKAPDHQSGTAYITSHRLFYIDKANKRKRSFCLDLSLVGQTDYYAGLFTSSAKITLHLSQSKHSGTDTDDAGSSSVDPFSESWTCEVCDYRNPPGLSPTAAKKCGLCGVPREAVPAPLASMSELSTFLPSTSQPNLVIPQQDTSSSSDNGPASNACPTCTFLNHPSLRECEMCSTPLQTKKTTAKSMKSAPATRAASPDGFSSQPGSMKLSFRKGGDKQFYTLLKGSLRNKVWEDESTSTSRSEATGTTGQRSGIEGIMRTVQSTNSQAVSGMEGAFQDLETLMIKAKDMVRLAAELNEKLTTATAQQQQHSSSGTLLPDFSEPEEATFIRSSLSQLGLHMEDTPVTKDMMRDEKEWIDSLAKELGRVLHGRPGPVSDLAWQADSASTTQGLMRGRGIMALDEVWGGWNRARGVALIPPSTMMSVIPRLPAFTTPQIYTRTFSSGLIVLHAPPYTAASFAARLHQTLLLSGPQSTMDIAADEAVSVGLAKELVGAVEQDGAICRDDAGCAITQGGAGEEGVVWWYNVLRDRAWDGQDYIDRAI